MAFPLINEGLLHSQNFRAALVKVKKRAEEQTDYDKVVQTFVQTDLPARCESDESQIVLGRRGTGKTHLIKYFQHEGERRGKTIRYCNCTSLGSGYPSVQASAVIIAAKYFASLLNDIGTFLLDRLMLMEKPRPGVQDRAGDPPRRPRKVLRAGRRRGDVEIQLPADFKRPQLDPQGSGDHPVSASP
jgi:hypothetical protein